METNSFEGPAVTSSESGRDKRQAVDDSSHSGDSSAASAAGAGAAAAIGSSMTSARAKGGMFVHDLPTVFMWIGLTCFTVVYIYCKFPVALLMVVVYFVKLDKAPKWFEEVLQQYLPSIFPAPKKPSQL